MSLYQPPFDPARDFVARRDLVPIAGRVYARGDAFDKDSVAPHILRRLYNTKVICFAGTDMRPGAPMLKATKPRKQSGADEAAIFEDSKALEAQNSKAELEALATDLGVGIAPRATKAVLARLIAEAKANGNS